MGLPFKNGFELAKAVGFGKMYLASKEQDENNVQMESRNMNKKLIRLTESDLHKIVRESVERILKESFLDHHDEDYEGIEGGYRGMDKNDYEFERALDSEGK